MSIVNVLWFYKLATTAKRYSSPSIYGIINAAVMKTSPFFMLTSIAY